MISNFSDIFRQNMLSRYTAANESNGEFLVSVSSKYDSASNPSSSDRKFFNKNNVLDLIRRKKYDRAIKLIKANKINAFSLFDGVNVFGKTYDKLPFVAAALALALEKSKNAESMLDKFNGVISELFVPSGINAANMFDAKIMSENGCNDVLSFILTHDGQINHKKYDDDADLDALILLNSLISGGYTLANTDGFTRYVIGNDLISTLKKMVESGMYSLNTDDMKKYSISPVSNIGRYISTYAPHPFRFHAPEVETDDKGKFAGGNVYNQLKNVGYDISKGDKEFKVHISIPFMIKDIVQNAMDGYAANGERFTNDGGINFGDGSEFLDSVNTLKYLSSEYGKYIRSPELHRMSEEDKMKYMTEMVKSVNSNILRLQNGTNAVLKNIGFPKVVLVMNNGLDENDRKLLFKTTPFMKEIWNSIKLFK